MPAILYRGELSPLLKFAVNSNFLLAWIVGGLRDTDTMKKRLKLGYDGGFADVGCYDETSSQHYNQIAKHLLDGLDLRGKRVLDVGCGTGIVSNQIIECGALSLVSGDQSEFMLDQWRHKSASAGADNEKIEFRLLDAENLPYADGEFDIVVSSMVMSMIPNQMKYLSEMRRVLKPGGTMAISTHGPYHYQNINEIVFKIYTLKGLLGMMGYRIEYWPINEKIAAKMLNKVGFTHQKVSTMKWEDELGSPEKVWKFYASTTTLFWSERYSKEKNKMFEKTILEELCQRNITSIMVDVIFCRGQK